MELIPILATIILMATISTFFLAIGAYVLFKIRERRGVVAKPAAPTTVQAELVTPEAVQEQAPAPQETMRAPQPARPAVFERPNPPAYRPSPEPIIVQRRTPQQQVTPQPAQAPRFAPAPAAPMRAASGRPGPGPAQNTPVEQKFRKYTAEGYASQQEEKKQAAKWR